MTTVLETRQFEASASWLMSISSSLTASVREAVDLAAAEMTRVQERRRVATVSAPTTDSRRVPTEFELRAYAARSLSALVSDGRADPSAAALATYRKAVSLLVREGGPTPQVGDTATGSIEIQWLVNGELVSALFAPSGEMNLYAEDASGDVLFDLDVAPDADIESAADSLRDRLASMGSRAGNRLAFAS